MTDPAFEAWEAWRVQTHGCPLQVSDEAHFTAGYRAALEAAANVAFRLGGLDGATQCEVAAAIRALAPGQEGGGE